jgi:hypothetical protein
MDDDDRRVRRQVARILLALASFYNAAHRGPARDHFVERAAEALEGASTEEAPSPAL